MTLTAEGGCTGMTGGILFEGCLNSSKHNRMSKMCACFIMNYVDLPRRHVSVKRGVVSDETTYVTTVFWSI